MCISPGIIEFSTTTSQVVSRGKLGEGALIKAGSEGGRGGARGPWPPQYLALPRLESSEKATTLANLASKPPFQNETRFEGKFLSEAKQSKF